MRIRATRRTAPSGRSQCDGVRLQRADGENARRQSERNHPMREHGSRWQQSGLRRLALLSDSMRIVFRNPFRAEHELESGLPHRLGRQDASSRIPRQSPQHRLERGERVGGVTDSQTPSRFGGGVRGTLRRNIQFEHRIAWRRSAGGAARHRLAFLGKDDSKRKRGMGRRLYHGATCLGERHSTRNRHGKTLHQNVLPANSAK